MRLQTTRSPTETSSSPIVALLAQLAGGEALLADEVVRSAGERVGRAHERDLGMAKLADVGRVVLDGLSQLGAEQDGRRVIGTAPTARAARELSTQAGIHSSTLDALLDKLDRGHITLSWKDVVVVDEAGMVGTRPGARLERYAEEAGAKVIEIGDRRQLQSVFAGGEVRGAWERLGGLRLTEVVRQRDPEERRALGQLHAGNVDAYVRFAEQRDRISYGHRP